METIKLDTGSGAVELKIPEGFTLEVIEPKQVKPQKPAHLILAEALDNPVNTPGLEEMARGKQKVAVIVCDNTRYLPQRDILLLILNGLKNAGVANDAVRIIVATGTHADMTEEEIAKMIGEEIPRDYTVVNHDAFDADQLVYLGKSKEKDVPIYLNKYVAEADFRIALGTVDPHIFAGYSGGNKILSVGVAGEKSIEQTHNPGMMEDPNTKFGDIENNTFRNFINEVASLVKVDFLFNVVQNSSKELVAAFAGHPLEAYHQAVAVAREMYEIPVERTADVVVTMPKVPKTLNLYQAIRSVNSVIFFGKAILKKGGTVILPAECPKGIGSDLFVSELSDSKSPAEYIEYAREHGFPAEANKAFTVAKMLVHGKLIVTDTRLEAQTLRGMHIDTAETATQALKSCERAGKKQHLIILTDGFFTLPVLNGS